MTWIRAAAFSWTILLIALCTLPAGDVPNVGVAGADKIAHFLSFAGFGWLWMHGSVRGCGEWIRRTIVVGLTLAVLTEVYQGVVPVGRNADVLDVLANTVGLFAGIGAYRLTRHAPHGVSAGRTEARNGPR